MSGIVLKNNPKFFCYLFILLLQISPSVFAQPVILPTPYSSSVTSASNAFTINNSGTGDAVTGVGGSGGTGIVATSNSTTNPAAYAACSGNYYGLIGTSTSGMAGVFGTSATNGVRGTTASANGSGVYGENTSGISQGAGVYGYAKNGTGVIGFSSAGPAAVYGTGQNNGVEGANFNQVGGYGAYGFGPDGVIGIATSAGTSSKPSSGVYGYGRSTGLPHTPGAYGVYGQSANATNNWAGYFVGPVLVTTTNTLTVAGNLAVSGSGKSFVIDHPLDPTHKFLRHISMESDSLKNLYDGFITTDANGHAIVKLPKWFEALNSQFRYQLTVVDTSAEAIIAKEIADNSFAIATTKPNVRVAWQVTGIRHDATAKAHSFKVEQEKPDGKRGKYLNPTVYGHSASEAYFGSMRLNK